MNAYDLLNFLQQLNYREIDNVELILSIYNRETERLAEVKVDSIELVKRLNNKNENETILVLKEEI